MNGILQIIIVCIVAYLIGSIPTGYVIVKSLTGKDIREVGSGSTGATNVKRVLGKKYFFYVLFIDALKGFIPVIYAKYFGTYHASVLTALAALFVVIGHSKSIFINFKGGKSVATGVGTLFALDPLTGVVTAIIWSVVTWFSKYVSLGSIVAIIFAPFIMYITESPIAFVLYTTLAAIYVVFLHRENIKRLLNGTENKVR